MSFTSHLVESLNLRKNIKKHKQKATTTAITLLNGNTVNMLIAVAAIEGTAILADYTLDCLEPKKKVTKRKQSNVR